jgi:hypothetical protein
MFCPVGVTNRAIEIYESSAPRATHQDFANCIVMSWMLFQLENTRRIKNFAEVMSTFIPPDYPTLLNKDVGFTVAPDALEIGKYSS